MNRFSRLCLILLAACTTSASVVSSAQGVVFEPNLTEALIEGKNAQFTAPNKGLVECETTVGSFKTGVASAVLSAVTVLQFEPKPGTCTAFGVKATVKEACKKGFDNITAKSTTEATFNLVEGCEVVVTTSTCKLTAIGAQGLAGTWTNGTPSKFVINKAKVNVTTWPETGICGKSGTGTESGTFTVGSGLKLK